MAIRPIAITMGDPSGIGPEIIAKLWHARSEVSPFFLIGDPRALPDGKPVVEISKVEQALGAFDEGLPVLKLPLEATPEPGMPNPANAAATVASIRLAVELAMAGEASAVVTNPINKKALYDGAGFAFPGHTEFLAELGGVPRTVMMLAGPSLRVVPVTIHIPLAEVPRNLTRQAILETARITAEQLGRDFGIARPRLALAGLNPHAGEGGAMGREEIDVIIPVVETLRAEGFDVRGPLPADTMFHASARATYDVALTMYHDQGLIPIKALDFDQGVNVTLGLPFIRTSPDHGTAYDIAGKGIADPSSLRAAVIMAAEVAARRAAAA